MENKTLNFNKENLENMSKQELKEFGKYFKSRYISSKNINKAVGARLYGHFIELDTPVVFPKDNTQFIYLNLNETYSESGTPFFDVDISKIDGVLVTDEEYASNLVIYGNSGEKDPLSGIKKYTDPEVFNKQYLVMYTDKYMYVYRPYVIYTTSELQEYIQTKPADISDVTKGEPILKSGDELTDSTELLTISTGTDKDGERFVLQAIKIKTYII